MADNHQDRLNVSVPASCMKAIDEVIKDVGLYSGRTDFLYSAIRHMYQLSLAQFNSIMFRLEESDGTSLEKYSQLKEILRNFGGSRIHRFMKKYPGPNVKQLPIRPNSIAYQHIDSLSRLLFQEDDVDRIQKTCRVSLLEYFDRIKDFSQSKNVFDRKYMSLREKASKSKIIIEYIDPDNPPE